MSSVAAVDHGTTFVNDLFKEQVRKSPHQTALVFQNSKMTYQELDQRSNQFARYLREKGVQANALVGFSLSKSLDLIVGILGILKAGGVYLPLDSTYPRERLEFMIKDAKPQVLVTESRHESLFANFRGEVVQIDKDRKKISRFSENPLLISISPNQLAYVIYTSGSTGRPKGIMVDHNSFAHGAVAHDGYYQEKLVGLLSSAISFDVSILMIFHLLSSGGTVYIPKDESIADAEKLVSTIENNAISYLLCVPSLYSMVLDRCRQLPSLKIVSLTGENIPNFILKLHAKIAPNAILYNEYGPSEYAIGTTIGKIYDPVKKKVYPVNVGKPLPNTYVYVLDENLLPVPENVKGEIFIGGAGLSKGYLSNSELTAEKFLSFRFTTLYRTGDFGRLLPDGNLEFLGRTDNQVKIRGNRVELGEVEQTICRYPQVNEAVVVCKKHNSSSHLVAYFTTLVDGEVEKELKGYLTNVLPRYMIPSVFVHLKSFPRTPNGKIDRSALLNTFEKRKKGIAKTSSNLERTLFHIWKKVLGLESIGYDDNFFDLGGDSLGIAKVQTLIEKELAINIPVTILLQYPTISQLSNHLGQQENLKKSTSRELKRKGALQKFKKRADR